MKQATIYTVPSDQNPSKHYEVHFYDDGTAKCSCPAWQFSSQSRATCKHIDRLKVQGKGFQAPVVTKVFRVKYADDEAVLVGDENLTANVKAILDALGLRKSVTVERIA